ncbi:MAG: HlyD family efflux transporter periplasmic adaptor subunit [Chloroflexi bacterium]|uniref:efflux RND transporter periplasmic adaptor subunit n=1 Tax=Candidatus Flexifilum breve TaxID=3140694 RepID=UPI003135B2AC|nr:HlyD family efflux transporter periplasmic adaptor subunit [Chloroflexota bacterium]
MTVKKYPKRGLRRGIVIISLVAGVTVVGFGGYTIVRSQDNSVTSEATSTETVSISERATVSTGTLTLTLDAAGSLSPAASETLSFGASAPVTEVLVQVGDTVQAGDVLSRLETTDADARIRLAELQLAQAQASLDALLAPPTQIAIDLAEANVTLAQAQLYSASLSGTTSDADVEIARLQEELARNSLWQAQLRRDQSVAQDIYRSGELTWVESQAYDQSVNNAADNVTLAETNYEETLNPTTSSSSLVSASASVENAQAQLDSLLAGATEDEIRQAEIKVEQAQLSLDSTRETLENYVLVAPYAGVIAEQALIVGVNPPVTGAITLLDTSQYTIDLSIAEADVVNVSEGQAVTVDVQAFSGASINGTITHLADVPTQSSQLVTYDAEVLLNATDSVTLRPGMSATATVILKQLNDVLLIPNRFISTDSATGENIVTVENADGTYTSVPVTIGERSTDSSEITSGLEAGQTIVIIAREVDAVTGTQGGLGLGGLLGGGAAGGGGQPPEGFQPPSGGMPSGGGFPGGGG